MRDPVNNYLDTIVSRRKTKISISIDQNALRKYPFLDKLQKQFFPFDTLNDMMNALEKRQEGFKVTLLNNVLRISLKEVSREGNEDDLGLLRIDGQLKDLCEVIRDDTRSDPRKEIFYSRKASILAGSNLSDEALLVPNHLPSRGQRSRHPLDKVSTEEVSKRRELADKRWANGQKHKPKKKRTYVDEAIQSTQKFFDKKDV